MSKLSLDVLAQRADQTATEDLLNSINGGTENDCHPDPPCEECVEGINRSQGSHSNALTAIIHLIFH